MIDRFKKVLEEMSALHDRKNHDYGNSFSHSFEEFGLMAAIVRMSDKLERIKALSTKKAQVDESVRDTLIDLANYAVMTVAEMDARTEQANFEGRSVKETEAAVSAKSGVILEMVLHHNKVKQTVGRVGDYVVIWDTDGKARVAVFDKEWDTDTILENLDKLLFSPCQNLDI